MGHRKRHAPKRGSLSFSPRKRAASLVPKMRTWPELDAEDPKILGFAGFKAGMTGLVYVENDENSVNYGNEVFTAATVVETPPLYAVGVVGYTISGDNPTLSTLTMAFSKRLPEDIERAIANPSATSSKENLNTIEHNLDSLAALRLLFASQPRLAGVHYRKPEIFETEIGGRVPMEEKFRLATELLGEEVSVNDVHTSGSVIDVLAVTKGKGFQGPVKRWGIKTLPPKSRKSKRKPGALGPWKPAATMYSVPAAGQMGFHRRTQYGVKILAIKRAEERRDFHKYGVLKSDYMIVKGSIPGPAKRFVRTRPSIRSPKDVTPAPDIVYVQKEV